MPEESSPAYSFGRLSLAASLALGALFLTCGVGSQVLNLPYGLWASEIFLFFGVPYFVLRLGGYDANATVGLRKLNLPGAVFAFALGMANFFALVIPVQFESQRVLERIFSKSWVESFDMSAIFENQTPVELGLVLAGIGVLAPLCEEYFFRGMLQRALLKAFASPAPAIALTAFIFSAFHFDPVGFQARFELGALFGLLAWKTGSVWPGVFAHAANNLTSTAIYFSSRGGEPEPDGRQIATIAAAGLVAMAVLGLAARVRPQWLQGHPRAEERFASSVGVVWALRRWVIAAVLSGSAVALLDRKGVALNFFDAAHVLRAPKASASGEEKAEWNELMALRKKARAGEAPLEQYFEARRAQIEQRGGAK